MDWNEFAASCYYRFVLTPADREVFRIMVPMILTRSRHFTNGLLVVNAKIRTISFKTGISLSSTKRCLNKLVKLGALVKVSRQSNNDRFLLGFRGKNNERYYFVEHLYKTYEDQLQEYIDEFVEEHVEDWKCPSLRKLDICKLNKDYRKFMIDYFSKPNILVNRILKDNKTVAELLFGVDNVYRQPLFDDSHLQVKAQIELPPELKMS